MAQSNLSEPAEDFSDDDLITCGICHNEIEDARSLVCLHTYCLECLREWSKGSKNEIICPACREPTPLQENGADDLRRNFFVTKLKHRKVVSRQVINKDVKIACTSCDVSDGNEAVVRCLECDDFLCQGCHKAHKALRLTKNHTVLTMVELRSGNFSLIKTPTEDHCKDHEGQILWLYCNSCDKPICRDCTVVDHPSSTHDFIKISDITASQREEIQELFGLCEIKKDEVDKGLEKINLMRYNLESTRNVINNAIDEKKAKTKRAVVLSLEKQASDLKTRVSELMRVREKAASNHEDKLQLLNSRFKTALDVASSVTTDGSDCDVASVFKHLTTTLHQLGGITTPDIDLGDVRFIEDVSLTTSVVSIGTIEDTKVTNSKHFVPVHVTNRKNGNKTRNIVKRTSVGNSRKEKNLNSVWKLTKVFGDSGEGKFRKQNGIALDQDGNVAVADEESKVKVFDIDSGMLKMFINTNQSLSVLSRLSGNKSSPRNVLVYQRNYIVNDNTHNLTVYNKQGAYIRQIPVSSQKDIKPACIAINSQGHVLVGYEKFNTLNAFCYSDGKHVSSVGIPFEVMCIAVSNSTDDKIVIRNNYDCAVIDSNGKTIHRLRPPSDVKSFPDMFGAYGLCTVGEGDVEEVFVSYHYSIHRFSLYTGQYLGCVTNDVHFPCGMAFTADGKLLVANNGYPACIKMFTPAE